MTGPVAEGGTGGHRADPSGPLPGTPFPLGATAGRGGTNFAVASGVADRVDLCLFDETGAEDRVSLRDFDAGVWHGFVPGIEVGQRYGYRIAGPYDPARGLRCNPAKLLLDPYAKALAGTVTPGPEIEGYAAPDSDAPSAADSAAKMPRSLVTSEEFAWTDDDRPARRYEDTIIYEAHVKGLTMRHPDVPPPLRGSYAGLAHESVIGHLRDLGVTTVELLPVHESVPESFLVERGLTNYWGYNTIGYFAPHQAYSAAVRAGQPGGQVAEFKAMVNALHRAGLEVLLDVVFNHTAEGNELGPTLCFRGLDNPAYYRLDDGDPRHYYDTTGTGNSLNAGDPVTLRLIMDSLRYWVTQMHVDGFRFDLAPTLGRQEGGFARVSAFFDLVAQDPVVSGPCMTASPCATWFPITTSTTRPTGKPTATGPRTTGPGTAARRARPRTRASRPCGPGSPGPCSPPCCCPSGCPCCWAATRWAGPSSATTTPTARTTSSPGSTGPGPTASCSSSPGGSSRCARRTRCSGGGASWPGRTRPTCAGSPRRAAR
ncbi:MAG TPA: alpha-amylase family glycosyl hydrolase [Streptosporangiaceae bacterium]|nr:alpha-amylase family glycosyl hydrolase [Streptosporangiaceae bacterium]